MTWLLWRQHRGQAAVTAAALALFGLAVGLTGVHMAHLYRDSLRNCPTNGACSVVGRLFQGYGAIVDTVHLTDTLPLLLGAFFGAVLIARETEHATNILVWTQSVTRRRWALEKVALTVLATVVTSAVVAALVTWWSKTPNAIYGNRFEGAQFDTQNIAPIAFALFAVALGMAAGSFIRRTLPALAVTIGGYAAIRVVVAVYVRPHYRRALTQLLAPGQDATLPPGTWTLSANLLDPAGHIVTGPLRASNACAGAVSRTGVADCLGRLGYHLAVTYQPASRYWNFQVIESAIFVVLAAGLVGAAIIFTLRRDA